MEPFTNSKHKFLVIIIFIIIIIIIIQLCVIFVRFYTEGTSLLPSHLTSAGITHVVAPIPGSHGTLVTPVPVTVVSQGSQVAHILTASPQLGNKVCISFCE